VGVRAIKQKYKRLRPFQADKEVQSPPNIAAASQGPTYPSGHGTFGAEVAILLAMMVPEKRSELFARGWQYGEQRIMSGVAYPSDWEAGRQSLRLRKGSRTIPAPDNTEKAPRK
jgi:acid phosphatase (class A)